MKEFDKLPFKFKEPTFVYAGIGSRETPFDICKEMRRVAAKLEQLKFTLRSGGAHGADKSFEDGVISLKEIFYAEHSNDQLRKIAKEIHPCSWMLDNYSLNLMARNALQIFGKNLDKPVDFVLCYTVDGKEGYGKNRPKGGTGQAVEMAARKLIPVINMYNSNWEDKLNYELNKIFKIDTNEILITE